MKTCYYYTGQSKLSRKGGFMGMTKSELIVETENVLGKKTKLYVGPIVKDSHAWEEKEKARNCESCRECIGKTVAIGIIGTVRENQSNGSIQPLEERILGICTFGRWPKILVPPRKELKKCRYQKEQATGEALSSASICFYLNKLLIRLDVLKRIFRAKRFFGRIR